MTPPRLNRPIALVDLDGTLADCGSSIAERLAALRQPDDSPEDELKTEPPPYILARQQQIMSTPGFWRDLRPIPAGLRLVEVLKELEFETFIFTKGPSDNSNAWAEKFDWCRVHVPELKVIVSEDKSVVHGDVLVEDWPPYIVQWRQRWPNGFVIIPAQPWNADLKALPENSIRFDGSNLNEIRRVLESIRKETRALPASGR